VIGRNDHRVVIRGRNNCEIAVDSVTLKKELHVKFLTFIQVFRTIQMFQKTLQPLLEHSSLFEASETSQILFEINEFT
jgi:hypothetical protein